MANPLEKRVSVLEQALQELRERLNRLDRTERRWWIDDAGRFANDPDFEEIVRLGSQYRKGKRRQDSQS
jgi:hypothetical protein